jgi:SEC-C motif/HEPN domain
MIKTEGIGFMGGAEVGRVELAERIKKVEEFVRRYQAALRALHAQLPSDGDAVPRSVAASLGRCVVWPCRDAGVVLTYADSPAEMAVSVKDTLDKSVSEFMKEGEVFTYYDDRGRAATLRVSFAPLAQDDPRYDPRIPPDNFSLRKINLTDVVAWAEHKNDAEGARVKKFFRPEFKKVSVYGWYAHLGDPEREALKDFRKAFVLANILGQDGEGLTEREKMQQAVSAADQHVAEFESLLDKARPKERAKEFLKLRPGIVHPAQLRCYTEVPLGEDQTADLLLLVQEEEGLEYVLVKLGGADDVFFTDSGQPSEAFLRGKETISAWEEWLAQSQTHMSTSIPEGSKVNIQLVIGRSSTLTYQQRKELRTAAAGTGRSYCTYDDLVNQFRYVVNDVTGVWDRFEPVDARLKKVGINTEEEFGRLMEAIDQEMREEETPIRARSMEAVGKFTLGYSTSLMHKDPLTTKIHEWFDRRYGDRLKIDPTWKIAVQIRGDLYRLRLPLVFGAANVICSPKQYGITSQATAGSGGRLPTINVLDLIDDFTEEYAKSLTKDELAALFNQFQLGFAAMNEIESISETELVKEAIGDIDASVAHLFANQPQFGLSKWASLQATEKIIKAFISQKGEKYKTTHKLEELASHAESLGLNEIPRPLLDMVQCTPGVRYGDPAVSLSEAVAAHHLALDLCLGVASQIFLTRYFEQAKELEAGKYYTNSLRKEYRCIKVDGDKATIMLFDEVMGKPLEAQFVQDRKYWRQYYILTDPATISRLERRYQAIVAKDAAREQKEPAKSPIKVGRNDPCPCGSGKKYKKCCGN